MRSKIDSATERRLLLRWRASGSLLVAVALFLVGMIVILGEMRLLALAPMILVVGWIYPAEALESLRSSRHGIDVSNGRVSFRRYILGFAIADVHVPLQRLRVFEYSRDVGGVPTGVIHVSLDESPMPVLARISGARIVPGTIQVGDSYAALKSTLIEGAKNGEGHVAEQDFRAERPDMRSRPTTNSKRIVGAFFACLVALPLVLMALLPSEIWYVGGLMAVCGAYQALTYGSAAWRTLDLVEGM